MNRKKTDYVALAHFLSLYPQDVTLFRFRELSLRNLLYYQAELVSLQRDLDRIEEVDSQLHVKPEEKVTFLWSEIIASHHELNTQRHRTGSNVTSTTPQVASPGTTVPGGPTAAPAVSISDLYREKMLLVRETLAKYNEAIEQHSRLEKLPCPSKSGIEAQHEWLSRSDLGLSTISGTSEDVWDPRHGHKPQDFFSFDSEDGISGSLVRIFITLRRTFAWDRSSTRVFTASTSNSGGVARGVSVVVASLFPVLPIVAFYFARALPTRIGIIFAFTAFFAAVMVFILKLQPEKVLAITTAIAAVQVVYVGSTGSSS